MIIIVAMILIIMTIVIIIINNNNIATINNIMLEYFALESNIYGLEDYSMYIVLNVCI